MNRFTQSVKSKIIRIGNSQGIRIPHAWLEQLHLTQDVELSVLDDQLVIRAARSPRQGWEGHFARATSSQPEPVLEPALARSVDEIDEMETEWDGAGLKW